MGLTTMLMAAGTGLSAIGALGQANAQKQDLLYQSQVANYNAGMAAAVGESKLQQQQLKNADVINRIKVAQAASGVDLTRGSAPDVVDSARELGDISALNIRNDAAREAYGYRTQSANLASRANEVGNAGWLSTISTLVGGAADINKYQGMYGLKIGSGFGGGPIDLTSSSSGNSYSWGF